MLDSHEYTATSLDDPWHDQGVFWSLAERNTIFDMIDAINTAYLTADHIYYLQIQAACEDSGESAAIILTAREETGPHPFQLQHLADCICRLVRPARYFDADPDDPEREIWSQVFQARHISAHQRLSLVNMIPRAATSLGRSDFGIEAALVELIGWPEDRTLARA